MASMGTAGKMSLPMNLVFENLFKFDPILSGLSSSSCMVPIREESPDVGSCSSLQITGREESEFSNNSAHPEGRKLFKKNSTGSLRRGDPSTTGTATLPAGGFRNVSLTGHFERSGSAKSYAKNRSPLSRLWQMRRKSFSHFELCTDSVESPSKNEIPPIGGTRGNESSDMDAASSGATGFFSFLEESHWESETDLTSLNYIKPPDRNDKFRRNVG
jgi:hypothetical protein